MSGKYVTVYIIESPFCADNRYDYFVPPEFDVTVGSIVFVPFGVSNRKTAAVVVLVKEDSETDYMKIKPIESVLSQSLLSEELLGICGFMKERTLCSFGEAVKAVVPTAALTKICEYYSIKDEASVENLHGAPAVLCSFIKSRGKVSLAAIKNHFGEDCSDEIDGLVKSGLVLREREALNSDGIKRVSVVSLALSVDRIENIISGQDSALRLKSEAHADILKYLLNEAKQGREKVLLSQIIEDCECANRSRINALEKKGLTLSSKIEISRDPYKNISVKENTQLPPLTEEQTVAFEQSLELYKSGEPHGVLLHGVTGSGKTRVIVELIKCVLEDGRDAIVLVPEIALTPQTVSVFIAAFGDRVAVIHSALSVGERYDTWRRIKEGGADVIIGTRSAVFAPVENLGLIVIDEEQEHTYKSDTNPKYFAHDIARKRCADNNSLMLLASATPSLQSYHKAKNGTYTLIEMKNRVGTAELPEVAVCDTRGEALFSSPFTEELSGKLLKTVSEDKQAIIFLNRRGYSSVLQCRSCGEPVRCPHCSVSLTYHIYKNLEEGSGEDYLPNRAASGTLTCHYCGYRVKVPRKCPSCDSEHMLFSGVGTQKAEEELKRILPSCKILRLDADTIKNRDSYDEILTQFREKKANVLLGTQIVTKGHDFPQVTLVGILNADASLYLDDYRANERTFSMLTQVIGRAGRAQDAGLAVIQTQNPDSDIIKLAAAQKYAEFYEKEIRLRRALVFPPFCDIAVFTVSSADEPLVVKSAQSLALLLRDKMSTEYADVKTVVFGPFEAPIYRVQNKCRMRMVIKCKLNKRSRMLFGDVCREFGRKTPKRLALSIDFNPSTL